MLSHSTEENVTSLFGMDSGVGSTRTMDKGTPDDPEYGLLWLPYVILTLILLSLLVASFIHFHYKYRDRYVKRSVLAKAVKLGPDCIAGEDSPEKRHSLAVEDTGSFQRVPSGAKTRRLKMFYGNKVDVSAVVVKSMFNEESESSQIQNEDLVPDRVPDEDDINHISDDMNFHMDGTPRLTLNVPRRDSSIEMTKTKNLPSKSGERPKYGVSIWTTAASGKKHVSRKEKAQTGL